MGQLLVVRHIVSLVESECFGFLLIVFMMVVKVNVFNVCQDKVGKRCICICSLNVSFVDVFVF